MDPNQLKVSNAHIDGVATLYHYQRYDEDHVVELLKTKRAFCSNISNFNDPWDCTMSFKIDDDQSTSRAVNALKAVAKPTPLGLHIDMAMDEALGNDRELLKTITTMIAENAYNDSVEWRRIYCLTPDVKSTLMWSHYAENHKGICLEFAVKPDNVFATAFKMIYQEEYLPVELLSTSETAFLPFIVKASCWSYEEEYRLFLRIHDPEALFHFPECMRITDNRIDLPSNCLTSIVLGCRTPWETGIRIQQLIAEYWPEVRVKKMFRHRDRYELEIHGFDATAH